MMLAATQTSPSRTTKLDSVSRCSFSSFRLISSSVILEWMARPDPGGFISAPRSEPTITKMIPAARRYHGQAVNDASRERLPQCGQGFAALFRQGLQIRRSPWHLTG